MEDYSQYIITFFTSSNNRGCGFFVGNYFVTAGHCLDKQSISFHYNNVKYNFTKEDALYYRNDSDILKNPEAQDIAIFKCKGINSPLKFSRRLPDQNISLQTVICNPYTPVIKDMANIFNDLVSENKSVDYQVIFGFVRKKEINYLECYMLIPCKEGDSGSPLLSGNEVYGILSGSPDTNNSNVIVFCSTMHLPYYFNLE